MSRIRLQVLLPLIAAMLLHIMIVKLTIDNEVQEITRTMMQLSRGGADAVVMREFDLVSKRFVPDDQQPFFLPEAKSRVAWKSRDVLLVGTDFHLDGSSMTDSGYPRVMKEWRRGTALNDSDVVHEGLQSDVSVYMYMVREKTARGPLQIVTRLHARYCRASTASIATWSRADLSPSTPTPTTCCCQVRMASDTGIR